MKSHRSTALLLALLLLALYSPTVRANPGTLHVTTGGSTSWPCGDASNWSNPCALQTALTNASVGDEIWVAAGTYKPTTDTDRTATFQLRTDIALYGGFAGGETTRAARNWTANVTILSGDIGTGGDTSDNSYHVVTGSGVSSAVLDGFTVTGGKAWGSSSEGKYGAGMYISAGSPTVANVVFIDNAAYYYGGGIYLTGNSSLALTNVSFSSNSAILDGGGIYHSSSSSLTLTNVTFNGNSAALGGGMYNGDNAIFTNVTFNGNSASSQGGAIYSRSDLSLTNVTVSNNSAGFGFGGGMYFQHGSYTFTQVTFSGNTARFGGGIYTYSGDLYFTNVTFSGNSVSGAGGGTGGGIYSDSGTVMLSNTTFSNNNASSSGGAIYVRGDSYTLSLISKSILWGNTAGDATQLFADGPVPLIAESVVQNDCPTGSTCSDIIATDPHLGALGNWGGSTQTVPLLPGSSAIDAGVSSCPSTDQRGMSRVGPCDIGAFESQKFTLTKTGGDNQSTMIYAPFSTPLRVSVSSAQGEPVDGGVVTFTAPSSGASTNPVSSIGTIASGAASRSVTANATVGSYNVTADTAGALGPVTFSLANKGISVTTLSSSPNPSLANHAITFTATVTAAEPASGTPTGTVELYETIAVGASSRTPRKLSAGQTLVNGVATFSVSSLALGTHKMQAIYSGDANYSASNSSLYAQQVQYDPGLDVFLPWVSKGP